MIKKILCLMAIIALAGCAATYTYDGQKYANKEELQRAVDSSVNATVMGVFPLEKPLTRKKLIFSIAGENTMQAASRNNFVKLTGAQPSGQAAEILENITRSNFKNIKIYFDAVQRRNIYSGTQFVEMSSMTGSFEASNDADVLYYIEPTQNSGQWYYTSIGNGKQIFAYDRSNPTIAGKVQAFVDAVQAQAIRE